MTRRCGCPNGFPVCACSEGHTGAALLARSRWLSHLAGYPARVTPEAAAAVVARYGRPRPVAPAWLSLPRYDLTTFEPAPSRGCGCGGRA